MLNIGLDFECKKPTLPFYFNKRNCCVHCGAVNSLIFIDKYGKPTSKEINSLDHIVCSKCGKNYSIKWQPDANGKMYPSAVEVNITDDFNNLLEFTSK